ncbi:hypothetical protein GDO81_030191 [Engystomops pustulosus]|uniref:Pentatricopeptide repeat-containing protein n=1 Tax=Engystomops pustulosus TaxID=76066 RepID=A0AAV6ZV86_ENGPU|nr:hypothetical protein GDO81_030191 [Engystomops pustulosus]
MTMCGAVSWRTILYICCNDRILTFQAERVYNIIWGCSMPHANIGIILQGIGKLWGSGTCRAILFYMEMIENRAMAMQCY